jgi:hypothetical protein
MKWTQQWVGKSFRTGPEMEQSFSIDKQINKKGISAHICTLTFIDLLHINCLHGPILAVSEQILPKQKMGRGYYAL